MTVQLQRGNAAPKFTLPTADGDEVSLDDLRGRKVILYFYPAAMSAGCTKEACDFRDNLGSLRGAGYAVLGVSPDEPEKLVEFREREGLTFPLLADRGGEVHASYGAWGEKTVDGRTVIGSNPVDVRHRRGWPSRDGDVQRSTDRSRQGVTPDPWS